MAGRLSSEQQDKFWNDYAALTIETAVYPGRSEVLGRTYVSLKLLGETGEVFEHIGKALRDDAGVITDERKEKLIKELGDVLWYCAAGANELKIAFEVCVAEWEIDEAINLDYLFNAAHELHKGATAFLDEVAYERRWREGSCEVGEPDESTTSGFYENASDHFIEVISGISYIAHACGASLFDVAIENLKKLASRKARGVLSGSGSDR